MADGKILIVEDEPQFVDLYRRWFEEDGYSIHTAATVPEARACLASDSYDVVLLDQRLPGSTETEAGLDLVSEAAIGGGKVFIVTGFATADAIERAFHRGAHDYLTKDRIGIMGPLLRMKVRRAVELVATERAASRTPSERDQHIRRLWSELPSETNAQRKGRVLEELLAEIFRSVPGFTVHPNERSDDEEIDLFITNRAADWATESPYFLVEAKNWSSRVGPEHYDRFLRKLERRAGRVRLGFLVSLGGFTEGVQTTWAADRTKPELVVLVDRPDLEQLASGNRSDALHELHRRAVVRRE